jgi:TatD DNase family protein
VRLTDTHCHLYFRNYQVDLEEVIDRAKQAGVERILVPAIDVASSREVISLIEKYDLIYGAVGVHPNSAASWDSRAILELKSLAAHPKVVALGEIGLDYYRDRTSRDHQKKILTYQLDLASEVGLPVILHVRNRSETDRRCLDDLFTILEDWLSIVDKMNTHKNYQPGVIHSFSGNVQESQRAIKAGFYLGIVGFVTFKNADSIRDVIRKSGLSRLLVETDGPFITPHPYRGKRNEPAHVGYIVDKISEVTGITKEQAAEQTAANAEILFKWE